MGCIAVSVLVLCGCSPETLSRPPQTTTTITIAPEAPATEPEAMKGTWLSFLELDRLLAENQTPDTAKAALDRLLDTLQKKGINTVFFHVRANSDAYYRSAVFKPAAAVAPLLAAGFDPLAYAVQGAHSRHMQLHGWVNPYRVGSKRDYVVAGVPAFQTEAGSHYYVPTSEKAQALILQGVRELLQGYCLDGIQFDDYFYPDGAVTDIAAADFETADYEAYRAEGGVLSVADWRRANVNALIAATHTLAESYGAVFGVSPSHDAQKDYASAYADTRLWLRESGYVDYLCPQIYFGFENTNSPFERLVEQWLAYPRHESVRLCVGLPLYKIGLKTDAYAGEGATEWCDHTDVMQRMVQYLQSRGVEDISFYSATYFDPEVYREEEFSIASDAGFAKEELQNVLTVLQ